MSILHSFLTSRFSSSAAVGFCSSAAIGSDIYSPSLLQPIGPPGTPPPAGAPLPPSMVGLFEGTHQAAEAPDTARSSDFGSEAASAESLRTQLTVESNCLL